MTRRSIHITVFVVADGNNYGTARIDNSKALENGLSFRLLKDSITDSLDWWYSDAVNENRRNIFENGPNSIFLKEKFLLEKWKALR